MKLEFTTILRKIGFLHENKNLMPLIGLTIHLGKVKYNPNNNHNIYNHNYNNHIEEL